jgi:PPOX class probable F420-dependent enzyme
VVISEIERCFLDTIRVAHFATADRAGMPHVVPVCFALDADCLFIAIDEKPKRPHAKLKRLRNIEQNPSAAVIADRYDEDWSRLAWVMLRGTAAILHEGSEHDHGLLLLRARYAQYGGMALERRPMIAVRVQRAVSWGALDAPQLI